MSAPAPDLSEARDANSPEAILERLYADHGRMVKRICRKLLRHAAEAEDAAQQTFLSAYRSLLGGTRPQHPTAWLATIARNECWARIHAGMREPLASHDLEQPAGPDAFTEVACNEDLVALTEAIGQLPPSQKEAFVLRELGGLSQREISQRLAISESALETLLFRARRRLRERLEPILQPLYGVLPLPLVLRELASRLVPADGGVAVAKIAAATAGVAVLATGVVSEARRSPALAHPASAAVATDLAGLPDRAIVPTIDMQQATAAALARASRRDALEVSRTAQGTSASSESGTAPSRSGADSEATMPAAPTDDAPSTPTQMVFAPPAGEDAGENQAASEATASAGVETGAIPTGSTESGDGGSGEQGGSDASFSDGGGDGNPGGQDAGGYVEDRVPLPAQAGDSPGSEESGGPAGLGSSGGSESEDRSPEPQSDSPGLPDTSKRTDS